MNRIGLNRKLWSELGHRVERMTEDQRVAGALAMKPRRGLLLWFAAVLITLLALGIHLHVRFEVLRLGYATSQSKAKLNTLKLKERALKLEIATLKAPARIEREARERLGMDVADYSRIIFVEKSSGGFRLASGKVR